MRPPRTEASRRYYLKHREEIIKRVHTYRAKKREEIKARARKRYATDADFREKQRKYQVEYKNTHKEEITAYFIRNRIRLYEKRKEWGKTEKGRSFSSLKNYKRRALLKDIGIHTDEEWEKVKQDFNHVCAMCGKKRKLTKDHIKPLTKGGMNTIDNIQPLCLPCNSRKGNRYPTEEHNPQF